MLVGWNTPVDQSGCQSAPSTLPLLAASHLCAKSSEKVLGSQTTIKNINCVPGCYLVSVKPYLLQNPYEDFRTNKLALCSLFSNYCTYRRKPSVVIVLLCFGERDHTQTSWQSKNYENERLFRRCHMTEQTMKLFSFVPSTLDTVHTEFPYVLFSFKFSAALFLSSLIYTFLFTSLHFFSPCGSWRTGVLSFKLLPKCRCSHLNMFACVSSRVRVSVLSCALAHVLVVVATYTWCHGCFSLYYDFQAGRFCTGVHLKHLLNGTGHMFLLIESVPNSKPSLRSYAGYVLDCWNSEPGEKKSGYRDISHLSQIAVHYLRD